MTYTRTVVYQRRAANRKMSQTTLFATDKNTYRSPRSRNGAAVAKAFLPSKETNHVFWDSPTTQLVPAQSPRGGELSPSTGTGPPRACTTSQYPASPPTTAGWYSSTCCNSNNRPCMTAPSEREFTFKITNYAYVKSVLR